MARTIDSDVGYVRMFAPEAVADQHARKAVARVTLLCFIVSIIVVAKSVWAAFTVPHDRDRNDSAQYVAIIISCILSLLIPACGYIGARDKNRSLLTSFLACNACCVATILFDVVLMCLGWAKYRGADCAAFDQTSARQTCSNYNAADATDYWAFATVQIVLACVYTLASYWAWGVKQLPYFVQMQAPSSVEFSGVEMQSVGTPTWARNDDVPVVQGVVTEGIAPSVPTATIAASDVQVSTEQRHLSPV